MTNNLLTQEWILYFLLQQNRGSNIWPATEECHRIIFAIKAYTKHGISHFASLFNTLRPRQNGWYFPDYIFKCIFLNENVWLLNTIRWKFVSQGPIDSNIALIQIMAWCWTGDKPLSEPMMAKVGDAFMCHLASMSQSAKHTLIHRHQCQTCSTLCQWLSSLL